MASRRTGSARTSPAPSIPRILPTVSTRWNAGVGGAVGPAEVRLADGSLVITGDILEARQPSAAKSWNEGVAELRRASGQSVAKTKDSLAPLKKLLAEALPTIAQHRIT